MERPSAAKKNQNNAKAKRAQGGKSSQKKKGEKSFGASDFQQNPLDLVSAGDWRAASAFQSLLSPYKKQAICLLFSWITQGKAHKSAGTAKSSSLLIPAPSQHLKVEFWH